LPEIDGKLLTVADPGYIQRQRSAQKGCQIDALFLELLRGDRDDNVLLAGDT